MKTCWFYRFAINFDLNANFCGGLSTHSLSLSRCGGLLASLYVYLSAINHACQCFAPKHANDTAAFYAI